MMEKPRRGRSGCVAWGIVAAVLMLAVWGALATTPRGLDGPGAPPVATARLALSQPESPQPPTATQTGQDGRVGENAGVDASSATAPVSAPTATPLPPTATPLPPTATPVPTALPAPLTMAGQGTQMTADFETGGPLLIVEFNYTGDGYFAVWLRDAATAEDVALIANEIGPRAGSASAQVEPGRYFYQVDGDGAWTLTTKLAGHWPVAGAPPLQLAGQGSTVSARFGLAGGRVNFALTHAGDGYFGVWLTDVLTGEDVDLLANESGPVSVTTTTGVEPGEYLLRVDADGAWAADVMQ